MKRFLWLVTLMSLSAALPALGQPPEPGDDTAVGVLTAVPRELRAGDDLTVTGSGCAPGNQVLFELYNPNLQSSADGVVRGDGTFVQSIHLAPTTRVGRSWLRATCLTPESEEKVTEAVLLVSRPEFVVTWTNVAFGAGFCLVTAGIGLAMLRQPDHHRRSSARRGSGRKRRQKKKKRAGRSRTTSSRAPGATVDGVSLEPRNGPRLNGRGSDRTIEVD